MYRESLCVYGQKSGTGPTVWGHFTSLSSFADQGQNDMNDLLGLVKVRCVFGCVGGWGGGGGGRAVAESVELNFTRLSPPA